MTRLKPDGSLRWRIAAAFACIYFIWGSTYLAIRLAVETLPPLTMAGARFGIAGAILYAWSRLKGAEAPRRVHWRSAAIAGGFLLLGGNGGVVWAEQYVPSGLTALTIATVPLWMVLLDWLRPHGVRPSAGAVMGVVLGLAGIALLLGPGDRSGASQVHPVGAAVLVLGSLSWSIGSIASRGMVFPASPLLATAMEMLTGGGLLVIGGALTGEWGRIRPDEFSFQSVAAFIYLILFGSLVGFTAYVWLLRVTTPARVSTYAFVNPVFALFLGWLVAGEPITLQTLVASAIIVTGVASIILPQAWRLTNRVTRTPSAEPNQAAGPSEGESSSTAESQAVARESDQSRGARRERGV